MKSLQEIHELEVREAFPEAIEALESRLSAYPDENETIIRLGFNYWLLSEEGDRTSPGLNTEQYPRKFMELYHKHKRRLRTNADFCFAFGLGMSLFWYMYPEASERLGKQLLRRAWWRDPIYRKLVTPITWLARFKWRRRRTPTQEELRHKFSGRGVLAKYYNVA